MLFNLDELRKAQQQVVAQFAPTPQHAWSLPGQLLGFGTVRTGAVA